VWRIHWAADLEQSDGEGVDPVKEKGEGTQDADRDPVTLDQKRGFGSGAGVERSDTPLVVQWGGRPRPTRLDVLGEFLLICPHFWKHAETTLGRHNVLMWMYFWAHIRPRGKGRKRGTPCALATPPLRRLSRWYRPPVARVARLVHSDDDPQGSNGRRAADLFEGLMTKSQKIGICRHCGRANSEMEAFP